MNIETLNKAIFTTFDPKDRDKDIEGCIGFYAFRCLDVDHRGEPCPALLYGLHVINREGRISFDYAGGDAPSARAGLALDLHQAATARIRADAPKLKERVAFYIDDAGKVAGSSEKAFYSDRAPAVVATMTEADGMAIYEALTACGIVARPPSPPAPSL